MNEPASPPADIAEADLNAAGDTLQVRWTDGHDSAYPLKYLRSECPCASCRAERTEQKANPLHVLKVAPSARAAQMAGVEPVGRYGMRILWADGHQAGIYTFEHLRRICPCDACRADRPPDDAPFVHGIYIPG